MIYFVILVLAIAQIATAHAAAPQDDPPELVFSNLSHDETNQGSININGYDRFFSVTFPNNYDRSIAYPVVLFFHGCRCRPGTTDADVLSYLEWSPRLESYRDDFIVIRMSAFSEKKPETPQEVRDGGARGMWFWHKGLEAERDDYQFVDAMITALQFSPDINIDAGNIFAVGHSSGAIFLISYVLGGPSDLTNVSINDSYSFRAIAVTGGSTLRKGIVDFKENTPDTLPSVLHIQGEQDKGLWFNGKETGKSGIDFLAFADPFPPTIIEGLRDTTHGLTYSAWNENAPTEPSTLGRWAEHLELEYSGYEDYAQYYVYNFEPAAAAEKVLVGMRIKECGHTLSVDEYQSNFFRIFTHHDGDPQAYDRFVSKDTTKTLCRQQR